MKALDILAKLRIEDGRPWADAAADFQPADARPLRGQSYMGHQHYTTTQRYLHHKPRREDASALAEAFGSPSRSAATA